MIVARFLTEVKRGRTPFYRCLRAVARFVLNPALPPLPGIFKLPLRAAYMLRFGVLVPWRWFLAVFYRQPLFQARCASVGHGVTVDTLPWVSGPVAIHVGSNVRFGGNICILSARCVEERPKLVIKDGAEIGWNAQISVRREVVIEENARISYDCRIFDNDGHRREADLRAQDAPIDPRDIRPVRICRDAWIGNSTQIMKGVTIGEGAVIGAQSVVISDVPPYSLAMGNPAEVYFKNFGRPKAAAHSARTRD